MVGGVACRDEWGGLHSLRNLFLFLLFLFLSLSNLPAPPFFSLLPVPHGASTLLQKLSHGGKNTG